MSIKIVNKEKETKEPKENEPKQDKSFETPRLLRGMKDILPSEELYWNTILDTARHFAQVYGFGRIRTPLLEYSRLFTRGVGKNTDIVEKEMYTFEDKDGSKVTLRPEGTASAVRAYIVHGMFNQPQPTKLWYSGPMFRHERPQAGRYRQFHQIGFEVIGAVDAAVDAMLIAMSYNILKTIGIESIVSVNSIGSFASREAYITKLVAHYKGFRGKLNEEHKKRLQKNPLRILDVKDEELAEIRASAPQMVDNLDDESRDHFMRMLEYLDDLAIPYMLDPYLVRGLDYYNRTVFELFPVKEEDQKSQSAFCAGGRYDGLVEHLGGRSATPAAGFAFGIERIVSEMHRNHIAIAKVERPQIFVAHLGELGRRRAMVLFEELRTAGWRVRECFSRSSLRDQLQIANKSLAPFAFIVGQREVIEGTVIIRDMESGIQEIIDLKKSLSILRKKFDAKEAEVGSLAYMPIQQDVPVEAEESVDGVVPLALELEQEFAGEAMVEAPEISEEDAVDIV